VVSCFKLRWNSIYVASLMTTVMACLCVGKETGFLTTRYGLLQIQEDTPCLQMCQLTRIKIFASLLTAPYVNNCKTLNVGRKTLIM
jgi:hypothetical protein